MSDHEYSVVGHSRSKIGMYIAFVSGVVAGTITTFAGLVATFLQSWVTVPKFIMWPVTGGVVFGVLFLLFNKHVWRMAKLRGIIGVPDISGSWEVSGQTYDTHQQPTHSWNGKIEITQCYEKITVFLQTSKSSSQSVSAAIVDEGRAGWRLLYSYRNNPLPGEAELTAHLGHCDLLFSNNLQEAEGHYFNGGGRFTHGILRVKKRGLI